MTWSAGSTVGCRPPRRADVAGSCAPPAGCRAGGALSPAVVRRRWSREPRRSHGHTAAVLPPVRAADGCLTAPSCPLARASDISAVILRKSRGRRPGELPPAAPTQPRRSRRYSSISALVDESCSRAESERQLRHDLLGQHLAELDAPLVEGVDPPDRPPGRRPCARRARPAGRAPTGSAPRRRSACVGRLPANVLCGTSSSVTPSARTSSAVLPKARASTCANRFAVSRSWCRPTGVAARANPMKSHGISSVPWWMSW